jgi:outer membrane protein TolC
LRLRRYITEETVLHYNGMLKSVWDLLDEVRNQAAAEVDAIDAQRDFWLAEADLQWTLQGGAPTSLVSLGGGSAGAIGAAAH